MSSSSMNVPGELRRLIEAGIITMQTLEALTGINQSKLKVVLAEQSETVTMSSSEPEVTGEELIRLSMLSAQLTDGMKISDDDRLRAIIESLNAELHLSPEHIAQLTGLRHESLERILAGDRSLSAEEKYAIAIRCSFLVSGANLLRSR